MIDIEAPNQFGTQDIKVDGVDAVRIMVRGTEFMIHHLRFNGSAKYYPTRAEALGGAMDWIARELY